MSVGLSRRICQRWVYRYNEEGLAGLDDQRGTSRSSLSIPAEQVEQLRERLAAGRLPEDQVAMLRGKDLQRILSAEFGVTRSLVSVYHLLHKLGDSYLKPRPRHRKADAAKQAEFVEQLPQQ